MLKKVANSRKAEVRKAQRARIILLNHEKLSDAEIARMEGVEVNTVRLCLEKCLAFGAEKALEDIARKGAPREISDEETAWVLHLACDRPINYGFAQERWTHRLLLRYIHEHAEEKGYIGLLRLSKSKLGKILNESEIQPHKTRYYLEKRDPNFQVKMAQVLCVYKEINSMLDAGERVSEVMSSTTGKTVTVSYDEKPGIQAKGCTAPDLPPRPNEHTTWSRDFEYVRHGTLSLLAGIDLMTGEITADVSETHKSSDFIRFLEALDVKYADADTIRIILDNHSSHASKETMSYLSTKPNRFVFVFTPKHGSWLNIIECFFSKLTRAFLRDLRVSSKEELRQRLIMYIDEVNASPVIFRWGYKMDEPIMLAI
jgi:transposase